MAHNRAHYLVTDQWMNTLEIGASFWYDDDEQRIASIITVETGMARMQISATAADLRALAALFTERAAALEAAQAPRDLAKEWDDLNADEKAKLTAAFSQGMAEQMNGQTNPAP